MGIPSFVKYLKGSIPNLYSTLEKLSVQVDNVFLDFNYLIVKAIQKHPIKGFAPTEEETLVIIKELQENLVECFKLYTPKNLVYIALEGSSVRAKVNHTRQIANLDCLDQIFDIKHKETILQKWTDSNKTVDEEIKKYVASEQTSDYLQCGTEFIHQISESIRDFIEKQMKEEEWKHLNIIFSDEKVPGEVEQKIFDFIRGQRQGQNYNEDINNFVISSDSDLIMFSIPVYNSNIYISQNPVDVDNIISISEIRKFIVAKTIKELFEKNKEVMTYVKENQIQERVYHDFVLIFQLIGNDFLPALPSLENKLRSMYYLIECYKKFLKKHKCESIVTADFYISMPKLQEFIHILATSEHDNMIAERKKIQEALSNEYMALEKKCKQNSESEAEKTPLAQFNQDLDQLYFDQPKKPFSNDQAKYLSEEKYTLYYYKEKFQHSIDEKFVTQMCHNYIEGIIWTYEYVVRGCISNSWNYRYSYTPFPSDIQNSFLTFGFPQFQKGELRSALFNLLVNQSALGRKEILPKAFNKLMTSSQLAQFYPSDLKLDNFGKYYFKQSIITNLPIINEDAFKTALKAADGELEKSEKLRNKVSKNPKLFMGKKYTEGNFEENDFAKIQLTGLFQFEKSVDNVQVYKFKYPAVTPDCLLKGMKESEQKQAIDEKVQREQKAQLYKEKQEQQSQVPCTFGATCRNLKEGKCKFFHTEEEIENKDKPKVVPQKPCTKGEDCKFFKQGTCKFYHP